MKYRYYWNEKKDEQGRNISMLDGYTPGDPLCLAYESEVTYDNCEFMAAAEYLFYQFNSDDLRPVDYRGPSMSVGSVIEFDDNILGLPGKKTALACDVFGFIQVDISQSRIVPTDPRWKGVAHASNH
jgi:hypothetical protein